MKDNTLIGLYDELDNLVGYFHDEKETKEYMSFMNKLKTETKKWSYRDVNFKV